MGLIQDAIRKWQRNKAERKAEKEGYERGRRIEEHYEERKLSADERELMRWQEKDRQARIKAALKRYRQQENDEVWSGRKGNPVYAEDVVKGQKELFKNNDNIFSKKTDLFGRKDMFFK